jgi:hypothetical protein
MCRLPRRRVGQVSDDVVGAVVAAVRPARPAGHSSAWQLLQGEQEQIVDWVGKGLTVVKIGTLLGRRGVMVPNDNAAIWTPL